jgi:predicted transcriptional regulator
MVTHMKTTIDIADDLLRRAKQLAERENSTLKALAEEGLRYVLRDRAHQAPAKPIRIRAVKGRGLAPEAQRMTWQEILHDANERPHDWR